MRSLVGLGTYDAEKARDLGIPSILSDKPAEEAVKVRRATAVEASEKEASKFQLGATLPVLPARIVKRIVRGDFVDIAESSEANLELEMRNSAVADEGKASSKGKLPPVPSLASWAKRFCLYAGVVISAHPEKAKDMFAYMALILSSEGGPCGEWWRWYDRRFRQQLPPLESAEFGKLDQPLYSTALAMASAGGSAPPVVQTMKTDWPGPPRAKRRKLLACFAWNDAKPCVATPCRFARVCSRCGGEHKKGLCNQAQEASHATSGEGQRHA